MSHDSSPEPASRLLSLAAHELRSPLSVVAGYLHMLLGPRGQELRPEHRRLVELANSSCTRALSLTHEVSDLARLTAGTAVLNCGSTDVARLAAHAVEQARGRVPDIVINFVQPADTCWCVADAERLRSALEALIVAIGRELPPERSLEVTVERRGTDGDHNGADAAQTAQLVVDIQPNRPAEAQSNEALPGDAPSGSAPSAGGVSHAPSASTAFDQYRGGLGLSLPVAVLVVERIGGSIEALTGPAPQGVRLTLPATSP